MNEQAQPKEGRDSRVEDWFGQSVERDREVAEDIVDDESEIDQEAEAEFDARASGEREQDERHGEEIDPDQGRSAYRDER